MKKVSESTHKFLCALPIAGLVLLTLAMAALWAVALAYAIGVYIAWDSAMAFLTLFGLSFIGAGLCLISLRGLGSYLSKAWFDRFPDAPGAALFARVIPSDDDEGAVPAAKFSEGASDDNVPAEEANKQEKKPVSVKTILKNAKNENGSVIFKPKYLTMQNVAYVLLVLAVVFVIASALSFSMGTSWGTFGILIPIVFEICEKVAPELMIITLAASLAGSVFGDHCSPISDTTIMASAGAGCDHISHGSTQIPYCLTVTACCCVGYIAGGFTGGIRIVTFGVGVVSLLASLKFLHAKYGA